VILDIYLDNSTRLLPAYPIDYRHYHHSLPINWNTLSLYSVTRVNKNTPLKTPLLPQNPYKIGSFIPTPLKDPL
ncbi:unnamed protein product, partial [marine sediment metagenome]